MQRRHALALGAERDLVDPRRLRLEHGLGQAGLGRGHDQRALGGITIELPACLPAVALLLQMGITRQRGGLQQPMHQRALRRVVVRHPKLAIRGVAAARDLGDRAIGPDRAQRHLVAGQGTGLIGADHRGTAEGLDRRQPTHQGMALDHALHADGQRDGHNSGQGLRHHRDRQRDTEDEHVQQRLAAQHAKPGDQHDDDAGGDGQHPTDLVQVLLQWRALLLDPGQHAGDAAELGAEPGLDDDTAAAPVGDVGAGIDQIDAIADAEPGLGERLGALVDRHRFTGQRRLIGTQVGHLRQPNVGGHAIASGQQHQVARHQFARRHGLLMAVANHLRVRRRHAPQRLHRALGAILLHKAEPDREQHDDADNDGL